MRAFIFIGSCIIISDDVVYQQTGVGGATLDKRRSDLRDELGYIAPPNRKLPPVPGSNYNTCDRIKRGTVISKPQLPTLIFFRPVSTCLVVVRIGTIVPSFIFSQGKYKSHIQRRRLFSHRFPESYRTQSDTQSLPVFYFRFASCFEMFLYTLPRCMSPSSEDNIRFYLLRLSRRWCLTSVDCAESRINLNKRDKKGHS